MPKRPSAFILNKVAAGLLLLTLPACASLKKPPTLFIEDETTLEKRNVKCLARQSRINALVIAGRYDQAVRIMEAHPEAYGERNELLFLRDKGLVYQVAGHLQESIQAFEAAKRKFDDLYARSITNIAATW